MTSHATQNHQTDVACEIPERMAHPELDAFIQRALAKRPSDRFADASEMKKALEALPRPWFTRIGSARADEHARTLTRGPAVTVDMSGAAADGGAALARAGVPFEIVPGVSAAIAAPGLAGIPVTHRGVASGFVVVSGHAEPAYASVLGALPPDSVTVVVLMGTGERSGIRRTLQYAGWSANTPAALVVNASQPDQRVWTGTLATLDSPAAAVPAGDAGVIVIGRVVSLATATPFSLPFVSEETSWQPSTIQRR